MKAEFVQELAQMVKKEDLPNSELKWIAEEIGMEMVVKLILSLDGIVIYIPKCVKKHVMQRYARAKFNGHNAQELAIKCQVSRTTIYTWVQSEEDKNIRQESLFEV